MRLCSAVVLLLLAAHAHVIYAAEDAEGPLSSAALGSSWGSASSASTPLSVASLSNAPVVPMSSLPLAPSVGLPVPGSVSMPLSGSAPLSLAEPNMSMGSLPGSASMGGPAVTQSSATLPMKPQDPVTAAVHNALKPDPKDVQIADMLNDVVADPKKLTKPSILQYNRNWVKNVNVRRVAVDRVDLEEQALKKRAELAEKDGQEETKKLKDKDDEAKATQQFMKQQAASIEDVYSDLARKRREEFEKSVQKDRRAAEDQMKRSSAEDAQKARDNMAGVDRELAGNMQKIKQEKELVELKMEQMEKAEREEKEKNNQEEASKNGEDKKKEQAQKATALEREQIKKKNDEEHEKEMKSRERRRKAIDEEAEKDRQEADSKARQQEEEAEKSKSEEDEKSRQQQEKAEKQADEQAQKFNERKTKETSEKNQQEQRIKDERRKEQEQKQKSREEQDRKAAEKREQDEKAKRKAEADHKSTGSCGGDMTWMGGVRYSNVMIRSRMHNKAIDNPNNKGKGERLIMWDAHGGANQRWDVYNDGHIVNRQSQCAMSAAADRFIVLSGANNYDKSQIFQLDSERLWVQDDRKAQSMCIDISGANWGNGVAIWVWPSHGGANQRWYLQQ